MSKTLHGTVTVKLGDEEFTLLPTLKAVRAIEGRFGGLRGASAALHAVGVDVVAFIIAAGAGLDGKAAEMLPEKVWQEGVAGLTPPVTKYLGALYNPRGSDPGNDQAGTA
ncbi:hypothetical protein D8767_22270 [Pseudomonas sp. LTGT-11-2Z]|uniref:hypothetical protein n=1 Tax=Pseudomonas sp. LTGT-11-2Z TaxID=2479393 RepID=UPI000EFB3CAE|nr:hypothetical protein [Pseudomonas sp. LTGT-11-2Z]AYO01510.1 hypothetical protein D8767_22270 [Pseudomonas sp. LTGT-11-2Z]